MFNKLHKKIYLPIILIAITLIVLVDIIAIVLQAYTLEKAYLNMGEKRIARAMESLGLYISSATSFTYNLSLDNDVINKLNSADAKSINDKLNTVCNYSLKMDAVSLYSLSGEVYTSSTVTQVPSLEELSLDPKIAEFLNGSSTYMISARTTAIADIYYNVLYRKENGIMSIVQKVYDNNEVIGVIFTDIMPTNLYGYIFAEGQFNNAIAFIHSDGIYLEYNSNGKHKALLSSGSSDYFEYKKSSDDKLFTITVFDSKKEYRIKILQLASIMLGASAALIILVVFIARLTAKSVTSRLDALALKMSEQKI